jgi:hypothetical protein
MFSKIGGMQPDEMQFGEIRQSSAFSNNVRLYLKNNIRHIAKYTIPCLYSGPLGETGAQIRNSRLLASTLCTRHISHWGKVAFR